MRGSSVIAGDDAKYHVVVLGHARKDVVRTSTNTPEYE
jgi:hypothetical protein